MSTSKHKSYKSINKLVEQQLLNFRAFVNSTIIALRTRKKKNFKAAWHSVTQGPLKGYSLFLDPDSDVAWHKEMLSGNYDSFIYSQILNYEKKFTCFWDVGAHIGYHSLLFASLTDSLGKVLAFEPNPFNIERFKKHLDHNKKLAKKICLLPIALSNFNGTSKFKYSPEVDNGKSSGSHLLNAKAPEKPEVYKNFIIGSVKTARADSLLKQDDILAPDVIKIDVEGAEHLVLEGGRQLLEDHRPLLFIEIHNNPVYQKCRSILKQARYTICTIQKFTNTPNRRYIVAFPRKD